MDREVVGVVEHVGALMVIVFSHMCDRAISCVEHSFSSLHHVRFFVCMCMAVWRK